MVALTEGRIQGRVLTAGADGTLRPIGETMVRGAGGTERVTDQDETTALEACHRATGSQD